MVEVEMTVDATDVQDGDFILAIGHAGNGLPMGAYAWGGATAGRGAFPVKLFHNLGTTGWQFLVRRKMSLVTKHPLVQGHFAIADTPAPEKLKDWPLRCPRCHRQDSAYLGLNQYDCKHGCYK